MLANCGANSSFSTNAAQAIIEFSQKRTNKSTLNKIAERVSTFTCNSITLFCKLVQSVHICYFCENSMMARTALVPKDAFASRFASMQAIPDPMTFF